MLPIYSKIKNIGNLSNIYFNYKEILIISLKLFNCFNILIFNSFPDDFVTKCMQISAMLNSLKISNPLR